MKPIELIQAAYDRLADEYDEDIRSPLMRGLRSLIDQPESLPADAGIELQACCKPNSAPVVTDQQGRAVRNVKSVAVFRDQTGETVLQINL